MSIYLELWKQFSRSDYMTNFTLVHTVDYSIFSQGSIQCHNCKYNITNTRSSATNYEQLNYNCLFSDIVHIQMFKLVKIKIQCPLNTKHFRSNQNLESKQCLSPLIFLDQDYLPSCISSDCILQLCKVSLGYGYEELSL